MLASAVAVVRASGMGLPGLLKGLVSLPEPRRACLRTLRWDSFQERALVIYFPSPDSYTGEDVVEFHVHGNPVLVRRLLEHLGQRGIRIAIPGEFTRRAILNGRMGLLEAEGIKDLIDASSDVQIRQAQARVGVEPPWFSRVKNAIRPWVARVEATVDYGDDEELSLDLAALQADMEQIQRLFHVELTRSMAAHWIRSGISIAIVGRPNAGKSTLFNALAGEDRAIVTEIPGTTRDVLEISAEWRGLPLRLLDTAGLRETLDPVERLGVDRVQSVMAKADLILHLIPSIDQGPNPSIEQRLAPFKEKVMVVRNQGDLGTADGICISALKGDLDSLEQSLRHRFLGGLAIDACLGALDNARQRDLLVELALQINLILELDSKCPVEIPASLLQGAWGLLTRLNGADRSETTLDEVFSGFCLGK